MLFRDRIHAGEVLGERLRRYKSESPLVLGLPRGGVVVAAEVARTLQAPLDVWVARKLGAPMYPEYGFGAIAPDAIVLDPESIRVLGVSDAEIREVETTEQKELQRRITLYRGNRVPPQIAGRCIILVDDGLATGVTARAAIASLRKRNPEKIIFAAPVCAADSAVRLLGDADQVECASKPVPFSAVGLWYDDFRQTEDDEVISLLAQNYAVHQDIAGDLAKRAVEPGPSVTHEQREQPP